MKNLWLDAAVFILFILGLAPISAANAAEAKDLDIHSPEVQKLMQGYFGNTRVCHIDRWFECHLWIKPDGTLTYFWYQSKELQDRRTGFVTTSGTWAVQGTPGNYKLCRRYTGQPNNGGGCADEPPVPEITDEFMAVGTHYVKLHTEDSNLKGTLERYSLLKGHM